MNRKYMKRNQEFFKGCLVGGAIGDALGCPLEFMKFNKIKQQYGESGIQDLVLKLGYAEITDDTQMTRFTAEGILRAETRGHENASCVRELPWSNS